MQKSSVLEGLPKAFTSFAQSKQQRNVEKTKNNNLEPTISRDVPHTDFILYEYLFDILSRTGVHYNLIKQETNYHPIVIILSLAFAIKNECKQLCAILYVYFCWLWR